MALGTWKEDPQENAILQDELADAAAALDWIERENAKSLAST